MAKKTVQAVAQQAVDTQQVTDTAPDASNIAPVVAVATDATPDATPAAAAAAEVQPKRVTLFSIACSVWEAMLVRQQAGEFKDWSTFRAAFIKEYVEASGATNKNAIISYNELRKRAEAKGAVMRDPKIEKVEAPAGEKRKPGRPAGSGKKVEDTANATATTGDAAPEGGEANNSAPEGGEANNSESTVVVDTEKLADPV